MKNQFIIDLRLCSEQELKVLKQEQDYRCVYCQKPMYLRSGPKRRAHFAHETICDYQGSDAESEDHYQAKMLLANWLQNQGIQVEIEHGFLEIRRIADIYFVWDNKRVVIEIQKSSLSEEVFQQRTHDYESLQLTVFWVFIGDLVTKKQTFIVNSVMTLNQKGPLIHLNVADKTLTRFDQITWVTTKEIYARSQTDELKQISISQLLDLNQWQQLKNHDAWFEIKADFRQHKWRAYMKQERVLCQICSRFRINLALLPAIVGWPIIGTGFRKPLFIWQAYILMSIVLSYQVGDCFTIQDLIKKLNAYFGVSVTSNSMKQLNAYLKLLINFGILIYENNYYEYKKMPIFHERLEQVLSEDYQLNLHLFCDR